ncbi:MAG: phosphoribosylformylglycinamidine cyclo-ligase [Actinobacteria bacterium]|nr:MAG: phosphoribosylformylglycinamidine cyclo-ligase [Actinomycetota bacterium]
MPAFAPRASPVNIRSRYRSRCTSPCSRPRSRLRPPRRPPSRPKPTDCFPPRSSNGAPGNRVGSARDGRDLRSGRRSTFRAGVLGDIGGFGGLFDLSGLGYEQPVLVSTTDGVGTKAIVAQRAQRYDTIGIDLVAMCVDDLVCQGAEPLFFLDYVAIGKLDGEQMEQLVSGVAAGCRVAGCALIGGEMAEHPGVLQPGEFDLVGFAVGAVERGRIITGRTVVPGDVVVGLPSPNLRSNGFSLARRLYFDVAGRALDDPAWDGADHSVADELLSPSVIYAPAVRALIAQIEVRIERRGNRRGYFVSCSEWVTLTNERCCESSTWA